MTHDHANDHDHDQQPAQPQIFLPPTEIMIENYRTEIARLANENFELRIAAEFQAGVITQLQAQLQKTMTDLSKERAEPEEEPATSDI